MNIKNNQIKVFYDSKCPLCSREMNWVKKRDLNNNVILEDITRDTFNPESYGMTLKDFRSKIYGQLPDGKLIHSLEVFREVYSRIGLGWLLYPSKLPILKNIFDCAYKIFAKNREKIGGLFGKTKCEDDSCGV